MQSMIHLTVIQKLNIITAIRGVGCVKILSSGPSGGDIWRGDDTDVMIYTLSETGDTRLEADLCPPPASLSCSLPYFSSRSMIRLWARIVESMQWPCTFLHSLQEISRNNSPSIGPQTCFPDMLWCFVYSCPIHAEYLSHYSELWVESSELNIKPNIP